MELSMHKLPWYGQVGLTAGLAVAMVAVFYVQYEQPTRADLTARAARLRTVQGEVAKGRAAAAALPKFKAEAEALDARMATLRQTLPEEKDVADLLRQLQMMAVQSNLTIKGFRPAPTVTKDLYAEWPIALELEGTYHNLGRFLDRLGRFERIVNVSALDIKGKDKPTDSASVRATCTATTFVLVERKPVPATGQPSAPAGAPTSTAPRKVA